MFDFMRRWTQTEHERVASNLSAFVDGELTAKEEQRVEMHLAQCDACTEDLRTLRYTKSLLAQAPAPRLPRSFVIRQVDLEEAAPAPRSIFGLRPRLAYLYLRGATAVVTVAFALLVAGDQIVRFNLGAGQPDLAMAPQTREVQQEAAVETTLVEEAPAQVDAVEESTPATTVEVEKETEKAALPAPTTSPPLPEKQEEGIRALEVSREPTENIAAVEAPPATETPEAQETYGDQDLPPPTPEPTPRPETATPRPAPSQPSPTPSPVVAEEARSQESPSLVRVAEIGLGGLALLLLIFTLIVRQQRL